MNKDWYIPGDKMQVNDYNDRYKITFYCGNCETHHEFWVLKGSKHPSRIKCPTCECEQDEKRL